MAHHLRRAARLRRLAPGPRLVLPVNVEEQEEAEGHHREERLEQVAGDGDDAVVQRVEGAGKSQQQDHRGFSRRHVA